MGAERKARAKTQTKVATHIPMSSVLSSDAAATDSEIPVPNATYAAKQAGHFGSIARITAGNEHFASAKPRRNRDDGWVLPSAALVALPRAALAAIVQQGDLFIGDSRSHSRMMPPLAVPRSSLRDNGHDGGPMTS